MNGRLTITVKNTEGVQRKLENKDRVMRRELKRVVLDSGERVYQDVARQTPVGSGYMLEQLRLSYHREGYTYHVGWYKEDFVGTERQRGRRTEPRSFYPLYVIFGTSRMAGRDILTPAMEDERPEFRRQAANAMRAR